MSNSLDPDQAQHFARPDLGPNRLQRLSADSKIVSASKEGAKIHNHVTKQMKIIISEVGSGQAYSRSRSQWPKNSMWLFCGTLPYPKMHPHTKFGFPTSTKYWRYALDKIIQEMIEVMVTVTAKWHATLHHPKMHPHNKFGIPTSKNIWEMLHGEDYPKM